MAVNDFSWPVPTAAYLHVPFCRHRCGYCNFSVVADRDDLIERFLNAIERELQPLGRPPVRTVFIGGGTPTHLPLDGLERLLKMVHANFQLDSNLEFSVEANPEDIDADKLDCLVRQGVNRISLGVQSFDAAKLRMLQRSHSPGGAMAAIEIAASKISNVSIDLIFAAPGETISVWDNDLRTALALPIKHLSTYALTFEKGTSFWSRRGRGELSTPNESAEVDMYQAARQMTAKAGWSQYEVSSFARGIVANAKDRIDDTDYRCRHNLAYWRGRGWYAVGPGAARFVDGRREVNHRSTTTYLKRIEAGQSPVAESESISGSQYIRERAAFGVRMIEGFDLNELSREVNRDARSLLADAIERSARRGLLIQDDRHLRLTEQGILFADTVASEFLG